MHRIELDYRAGSYRAPGQLPKRPQDEERYYSCSECGVWSWPVLRFSDLYRGVLL